jgi:nitrate reductase NapE component
MMDIITKMMEEPNATKRFAFFLFVFVPGFWLAVVGAVHLIVWIARLGL